MLLSNFPVKASNSAYTSKDFTITTILEDEFCTKLKFENKITGSIDYLTIFNNSVDERKIIISDENNETIDIMLQSDFVTY